MARTPMIDNRTEISVVKGIKKALTTLNDEKNLPARIKHVAGLVDAIRYNWASVYYAYWGEKFPKLDEALYKHVMGTLRNLEGAESFSGNSEAVKTKVPKMLRRALKLWAKARTVNKAMVIRERKLGQRKSLVIKAAKARGVPMKGDWTTEAIDGLWSMTRMAGMYAEDFKQNLRGDFDSITQNWARKKVLAYNKGVSKKWRAYIKRFPEVKRFSQFNLLTKDLSPQTLMKVRKLVDSGNKREVQAWANLVRDSLLSLKKELKRPKS